jgi:Na+-driven multidrug efflux pump
MSVAGVALATITSQLLSAITVVYILHKRKDKNYGLSFSKLGIDKAMLLRILRFGVPAGIQGSLFSISNVIISTAANTFEPAVISAKTISGNIDGLLYTALNSYMHASMTFTGQNYGARKYDRIREGLHICLSIAFISYLLLGSIMVFAPRTLAGLMLTGEDALVLAGQYLPICGIMLFAVDILFVFRSGCQAMGRPTVPMISGVVEMIMRILVIVLFVSKIGFAATAWADAVAWIGALLLNFVAFEWILFTEKKEGCNSSYCLNRRKTLSRRIKRCILTVTMQK